MPDRTELPLDVLDQIDRVCDRDEAIWRSGERPCIEDYLGEVAEAFRPALLRDLVATELEARRRRGERPSVAAYAANYPELAGEIPDLLAAPVIPEQNGSVAGSSAGTGGGPAAVSGLAPRQLGDYRLIPRDTAGWPR
jgi:hypothetical protein